MSANGRIRIGVKILVYAAFGRANREVAKSIHRTTAIVVMVTNPPMKTNCHENLHRIQVVQALSNLYQGRTHEHRNEVCLVDEPSTNQRSMFMKHRNHVIANKASGKWAPRTIQMLV